MNDLLWWTLSVVLIVVGLAGTVLPALPGTLFILLGIVLGAWIDDFTRVGWGVLTAVIVLAVLAWVLDYVAGLLGAMGMANVTLDITPQTFVERLHVALAPRHYLIGLGKAPVFALVVAMIGVPTSGPTSARPSSWRRSTSASHCSSSNAAP